ncbi:hypothetical protein [Helicobacter sp. T3_23-1059]
MRKWILDFVHIVFSVSFVCAFAPNALFSATLPKALDSKKSIFVDGFIFYGGESESINCRVDTPNISEEELREMGIPKDAPLLYMGEEVCDRIKQSYFLANDTIADKYNDRDKRALLPNQVLNIIDTKTKCDDKPCMMNATGRFNLADRNEFAAIELLNNGKLKNGTLENDAKSSQKQNNGATSRTLGIIYKIFGYAGWREAKSDNETKIVSLPLSAFESYEDSKDSEYSKEAQKIGYGGFLAKESMLVNTRSVINSYSTNPQNFSPILLPSAYLGLRFARNITLFATPEAVLKSRLNASAGKNDTKAGSANNADKSEKSNPKDIILDSIYHNAKRATLGREALAKQGVSLSAPLLDKVFVLGLGSAKFEKIAQVLVIRGDSVYFWGYIDLGSKELADEILEFYWDTRCDICLLPFEYRVQEVKKAYSFIPRENMPRQISLNELREVVKVEYPAQVKAVVDFEAQRVEYARKPYIDDRAGDSIKPSEKITRDLSGYVSYYQLPISGALSLHLDKKMTKQALEMAKSRGERELEIALEVDLKKGDLPITTLHKASDTYSAVEFRFVSESKKQEDLAESTNKDLQNSNKEELLCIGEELAKHAFVPMYDEKWQVFGFLDKVKFRSENMSIEKILGLNNTGRGDYFIVNIRNKQGEVITRNVRISKSALLPCEKYDIASSPDYAKAGEIMAEVATPKRLEISSGEWILKLGQNAVGNAKRVASLKEAIKMAKSWDSDAGALEKLDIKRGDKRVEYDRGKGYYPQKIAVDFVFLGDYENFISMVEGATLQKQGKKASKDSNVFKQKILVILPYGAFVLSNDEVVYVRRNRVDL